MAFPAGNFKEARLFGQYVTRTTVEFSAGTTGATGFHDLFSIANGPVHVVVVAYCTEDLTGAGATISLGTDDVVACLIAVTTATDIDDGLVWFDDAPSECESNSSIGGAFVNDNIGYDVLVAAIEDGTLTFVCYWTPVADGATVAVAV